MLVLWEFANEGPGGNIKAAAARHRLPCRLSLIELLVTICALFFFFFLSDFNLNPPGAHLLMGHAAYMY